VQLSFLTGEPLLLDARFPMPLDRPFTTAQARAEGLTSKMLFGLVRDGLLHRPLRGVYVASQLDLTRSVRGQALALVAPPASVVSDWTATWYWTGVDHPAAHERVLPLSVFRFRGHGRLRNGLVSSGQRWFKPSDVVPLDGNVSVSTPIRTSWDLGRFTPRIIAIGGIDALARHGSFSVAELVDGVERFKRQRGVVQLRHLAPLVDPRSESPGESALRLRWWESSVTVAPEVQVAVRDAAGYEIFRIDLGVEKLRFGAEYDGESWHSSDADRAHDDWRRGELTDMHDWHIEVFRREHVYGQHEDASSRLPRALEEAQERARRR
jgi:hypothetical protein